METFVGCSGWSYDAWLGHFYPANLEGREFLKYYSQVFDFVEIDSSFYRTPNLFMTKRWAKLTPDNFRFAAKFPRSITHEKRLADPEKELRYFLDMMRPLQKKLLALLIQLPPSLSSTVPLITMVSPLPKVSPFNVAVSPPSEEDDSTSGSSSTVVANAILVERRMAAIAVRPITLIPSPNVGEVVNIISKAETV